MTTAMLMLGPQGTAACARLCTAWPRPTLQHSLQATSAMLSWQGPQALQQQQLAAGS